MDKPFSVMVKPVGSACNLNCQYCYYHKNNQSDHSALVMSDTTLDNFVRQYLQEHPGPIVSFVWHGGEPLLAGIDFYKKVIAAEKKYQRPGLTVWNNIQTNGTLINDNWCLFLKENNFTIGLSIDGIKSVHDAYRGDGTFAKAQKACQLLKKYKIETDLLCTVNSLSMKYPKQIYNALKEMNTGWIQFIPVVGKDNNLSVKADAYGKFINTIFDLWYPKDMDKMGIQLFAETAMLLNDKEASLCTLQSRCGQAIVVEKDGNIYACDHFVDQKHLLGNINNETFTDIFNKPEMIAFSNNKSNLAKRCQNCLFKELCYGGCQKDRFLYDENEDIPYNYLCNDYKAFYEHCCKPLKAYYHLAFKGLSHNEIIQILKKEK